MNNSETWVPRKYRAGSGNCVICREPLAVNEQECCQKCQAEIAARAKEIRERNERGEGVRRKTVMIPPSPYVMRWEMHTSIRRRGFGVSFQ